MGVGRGAAALISSSSVVIRSLVEAAVARRVPLLAAFIDLAKAFDSVDREMLMLVLRSYGMPRNVMRVFESMYRQTSCAVRVGQAVGARFQTGSDSCRKRTRAGAPGSTGFLRSPQPRGLRSCVASAFIHI